MAYYALGSGALSFVGTFFVAPLFKSSFKEDADWQTIYADLVASGGVPSVTPAAAYAKRKSAVLMDVRVAAKYESCHAEGARSAPLYTDIQEWDPASIIRRVAFAFFGLRGTELNASFAEEAAAVVPKGREVILICEMGGSLANKSGTKFGFQSRSLKAAWFLRRAGFTKVSYVQGGLAQWMSEDLPLEEGPDDGSSGGSGGSSYEEDERSGTARGVLAGLKLPALSLGRRQ